MLFLLWDFTHELSWRSPGLIVGGFSNFRLHLWVVHHHIGSISEKKTEFINTDAMVLPLVNEYNHHQLQHVG